MTARPPISIPSARPQRPLPAAGWTAARIARLAFLLGLGSTAEEIGGDPAVAASAAAVRRQALRLGLTFREATGLRLPRAVHGRYATAAGRRGISTDRLIHLLLVNAGSDDALISNILDDGA